LPPLLALSLLAFSLLSASTLSSCCFLIYNAHRKEERMEKRGSNQLAYNGKEEEENRS
jgi:hypothetical protein